MDLLAQVESQISARNLLEQGGPLIVAVSGGVDSMVLLHLLTQLAPALSCKITVAHFNHQLRGREGDLDEQFVREQAENRQLQFCSSTADVRQYAQEHGLSIEMAARALRHRFFAALAESLSIDRVALAHHADDQVENLWICLLRGSAGEGLSGMKWLSPSAAKPKVMLLRPLLNLRRREIEAFAEEHRIPFRTDASNETADYLRNRIRLELLPIIERNYQPAIVPASLRLMDVLGAEKEWLNQQAFEWLRAPDKQFSELHPALQRAVLHLQIIHHQGTPSFDLIEHLRLQPERAISIRPGEQLLRASDGLLRIEQTPEKAFRPATLDLHLAQNSGTTSWGGLEIEWSIAESGQIEKIPGREVFDADRVGSRIRLRHWQPGDLFQPIGMSGPAKLQDIFTNKKIPPEQRRALVLTENTQGQIFWVESLRIGESAKVTPASRRFLHWRWLRLSNS